VNMFVNGAVSIKLSWVSVFVLLIVQEFDVSTMTRQSRFVLMDVVLRGI
jgi:hypothetical protein